MAGLSILVRCSEDFRFAACVDSIDDRCEVVAGLTPNAQIERMARDRGIRYALSPRGNPAATTLAALPLCSHERVLLVDSDCVFLPGAIARMMALADDADIVRPTILFKHVDRSSYATTLHRTFQYTYCGFVYEPGLLVNLKTTLPAIGGYLFSPHAPFTPDGELDFRVRGTPLRILTDPEFTLVHDTLRFSGHLRSYWRYGASDANRNKSLGQPVLSTFLADLPERYRLALSAAYPAGTTPIIAICDVLYVASMLYHLVNPMPFPGAHE